MTHHTLTQQVDQIMFSDAACELFATLTSFDASDECGAVLLIAAASLLARQHPDNTPRENDALFLLGAEFTDLAFEVRKRMNIGICRPVLRVVGGIDVH